MCGGLVRDKPLILSLLHRVRLLKFIAITLRLLVVKTKMLPSFIPILDMKSLIKLKVELIFQLDNNFLLLIVAT